MTKQHSPIYQPIPLDLQQWVFVVHFVVILLEFFEDSIMKTMD
jgi:hypothetical protein